MNTKVSYKPQYHEILPVLSLTLFSNNFGTARKSGNISSHTEKLFSSDTRQSMKRRIATERLFKIYIARCGCTLLDESKWSQEWPSSPVTIICLKIPSEKIKSFCLHKTGLCGKCCLVFVLY